ncbi:MAG: 2'-5' RNA ligase family protein [Leptolyngbyaceae cyanobacterium SL_5_9]|nr:2'-5' RNA ligase family protein [Leptolyngbyaceae cyanobacterium SL_5_9]NJO74957.1 2'-5' RNA ligase family protein [Leptolyngbyaceae cyanobacterium RM1_406_9]
MRDETRFFVALLPSLAVQEYAEQVIQELGDRYQTSTSKSPPHVTLQPPFQWQLQRVAQLEQVLSEFAGQWPRVSVQLSGFGAFVPRVLYINVLKTAELLALQAALATALEEALGIVDPKSKSRTFSPHLTVASRNLTRQSFRQAWTELQARQVEFEFVGDRLTLLIHDGQCWQVQSEFALCQ